MHISKKCDVQDAQRRGLGLQVRDLAVQSPGHPITVIVSTLRRLFVELQGHVEGLRNYLQESEPDGSAPLDKDCARDLLFYSLAFFRVVLCGLVFQ